MTGDELLPNQLTYLVKVASRHHRNQIAGWVSLTAHTRRGEPYFRDVEGAEVPFAEVCELLQADNEVRRWTYNLYMHYGHFGYGPT